MKILYEDKHINEGLTRAERHNRMLDRVFQDKKDRDSRMSKFLKDNSDITDDELKKAQDNDNLGLELKNRGLRDRYWNEIELKNKSLKESYTKVDTIEYGEDTYRVVGGGFNPTADSLVTVEDEHGERTRMHIGDVIEFYTWYDRNGNVIHEPSEMDESVKEDKYDSYINKKTKEKYVYTPTNDGKVRLHSHSDETGKRDITISKDEFERDYEKIDETLNESEDSIEKETNDDLSVGSVKEMSNVIFDTLFNNTQYPQFDFSKVENQEVDANKGQIVFDYMGHGYKITVEESAEHFTESKTKTLTESSDNEDRVNALAKYLDIDPSEISNIYDYEYETPVGDYYVVTEYEARELAKDDIRNLYDDLGLDSFTSDFKDWIIMNALDNDWFEDAIKESYEYYVEDIEGEASSIGYENRLIEEMHDHQVLSDDDFEEDEDGMPNLRELKEDIDIDDKKEEFIDLLVENAGNPVEYCADNYGWDWVTEMATQNNLIDIDAVIDQCIYVDGIAHFIARYDGDEIDLGEGLFAYRTN